MKAEAIEKVVPAIRRVLSGDVYVSDALASRMLQRQVRGHTDIEQSPVKGLSDRELEVFQLIGNWKKTKEIAQELHLSIKTIEYYREQIKRKLNLKSAAELTQHATTGPISHTFTLTKIGGKLNILVNSDGTWNFSGSSPRKFQYKDFDVTLALKNNTGAIILFEWSGDASNGIQFSKEGKSSILKENFASFASGHHMAWDYRFEETAAGRAKLYAERQARKEKPWHF